MKTSHGILALSAAALLAIATAAPSFSEIVQTPSADTSDTGSQNTDQTGSLLLGVNIEFAGNTPAAVQNFVSGLTPDQARAVQTNCGQVLTDGSAVGNLAVLQFCHNLQAG